MTRGWWIIVSSAFAVALASCARPPHAPTEVQLGAAIFADRTLSRPIGQSCADCHTPARAFTDPESDRSTSNGAVAGRFGSRNAPTAMYTRFAPPLHVDPATGEYTGGLFWDGRSTTLEDQASHPLLGPLEMNALDKASVVAALRTTSYAGAFRAIYGAAALDDVDAAFSRALAAIAAYERSPAFARFSSKYDRYLAGAATLTDQERRGLALFEDPARGNCAGCHPSRPSADGTPPLFTNFSYANLGIPKYGNSRFRAPDGAAFVDHGLAITTGDPAQDGKFRVPTLRNVAVTGPYGHNGYFENLHYMLSFLATRDGGSPTTGKWAPPEVAANVDARVGRLPLSPSDLYDLLAFLGTLTDE